MNGRLYDPLLRRFLNADEHIQDPYNTQNYNKYGYVYNNPLMYNDPSGEFAFLAPIFAWVAANAVAIGTASAISAVFAGLIYTIDASINNSWTLGGFAKAVFGGALTGAVSGALGQVFSAGGFWATVGNGTLAGAGGGGMNALINGQNFLEGLAKGAVIGGAVGAISYGLGKLFNNGRKTVNYEMETTSENTIKVDDSSIQNQNAKEAWQENWKEIYESTKNNKPAYLMKVGSVPKGYIEDPNTGFLINQETGNSSWAVTQTNYKNGIVIKHNLFLSKAALSSKQQLNYVMNHEFGHMVLNNNYGEAINKVIGSGLIDTAAHRAIQVTGSKFLQLNNWSKLNLGGVFKGSLIGNLYPEYGHLKQLEKLIIKIK